MGRDTAVQGQLEQLDSLHERLAEINESLTRTRSDSQVRDLRRHEQRITEVATSITNQADGLRLLEAQIRDLDRRLNQINRSMDSATRESRRQFNQRLDELQRRSSIITPPTIVSRLEEA